MIIDDLEKHMAFLIKYSRDNKIVFSIRRKTASIEDVSDEALAIKKKSKLPTSKSVVEKT